MSKKESSGAPEGVELLEQQIHSVLSLWIAPLRQLCWSFVQLLAPSMETIGASPSFPGPGESALGIDSDDVPDVSMNRGLWHDKVKSNFCIFVSLRGFSHCSFRGEITRHRFTLIETFQRICFCFNFLSLFLFLFSARQFRFFPFFPDRTVVL